MSEQHDYDGIKYRDEKRSPRIFTILFAVLVIWGVAFMGHYLFSGWSSQSEADSARRALTEKKQDAHRAVEATTGAAYQGSGDKVEAYVAAGKQLYANLCAACHGENGKGTVGPDLTASRYKYGKARLDISRSISEGRPGGMPAFNGQINPEQVEGLVEFVLSLK
jgi:cytochrome c oxidase cbb3-type subunit 3